ncbi:MAG TPA: HAMP domain-containing sensor histidine kinase [Aquabacterium sp.]|uniref:sensor histidine kinase n=1 Tax=Aquabacterium sp. TaxID=1872578 RepID=UPI002E32237A|nr:HAMP domain-containing sensor histidine kinase [Aquabacterium sp.]HEX5357964.1 HAMP domain-containing sensor histidine kinase [Aquabacterium sp.]
MTDAPSIRKGLSRVVIQVSLAWSVAVFLVVWFTVHHKLDDVLDGTLQESAEILYGLLKPNADRLPIGSGGSLPAPPHHERMVWQLVSGDRRVVWRSHSAPAQPLATVHRERWSADSPEWHVYGIPFDGKGTMLYVAQTHSERRKAQLEAALLTACGALMVGLASAFWLSRRAARELDPLIGLSEQVARYHPLEPGSSPPMARREELKPVRDAIVHLGDRLAQNIISERAFSANAAHALRTPLAGLGAQLAMLQRESPADVQPRIQRAREAADRLSRVVTALLSLFRSGGEINRMPVTLAAFVHELPLPGLAIKVEGDGHVEADPDLLAAALLNLLDNSVRYGAVQAWVSFRQDAGAMVIRLVDDGPGVDEATRKRIGAALASQHYEQDMGLGLMLADRVARAHGGQLVVVHVERGFGVELSLSNR